MKYFLGITTYNRLEFLERAIESWANTRSKESDWTLVVTDDGSTDGTVKYLDSLNINGVKIIIYKNNRVGVHFQTNQILSEAMRSDFDFGFKIDDDIEFLSEGWDKKYQEVANKTNFYHLIKFDIEWHIKHIGTPLVRTQYEEVITNTHIKQAFGAFWTFNREVIDRVGYFDIENFGKCGWGHVDYSWRCCRAGFNNEEAYCDITDSNKYIKFVTENYRSAQPMQERISSFNTPQHEKRKKEIMAQSTRMYINK